jgi:hypothetical protein
MTTRFDLEQAIMDCWGSVDTFKQAAEFSEKISDPALADELANVLLGASSVYQMKFERLFRQFEEMIASGKIKS